MPGALVGGVAQPLTGGPGRRLPTAGGGRWCGLSVSRDVVADGAIAMLVSNVIHLDRFAVGVDVAVAASDAAVGAHGLGARVTIGCGIAEVARHVLGNVADDHVLIWVGPLYRCWRSPLGTDQDTTCQEYADN